MSNEEVTPVGMSIANATHTEDTEAVLKQLREELESAWYTLRLTDPQTLHNVSTAQLDAYQEAVELALFHVNKLLPALERVESAWEPLRSAVVVIPPAPTPEGSPKSPNNSIDKVS